MPVQIIAHRGASGERHENSMAAFHRAVETGADGIELDIHATRDGAFAVHHDPVIPGLGAIGTLRAADVVRHRLPNGEPVPLLPEVLTLAEAVDLRIEVKALDVRHDAALLELLAAAPDPRRCTVHGFDHRIVRRLGGRAPELRTGILLVARVLDPVAELAASGASALWQEWSQIDEELVTAVHQSGRAVIAWTVDEPAELMRLIAMGVDAVCTNVPARARALAVP